MRDAEGFASAGAVSWYHKPIPIALLTVFVLGPLGLPLVWRSPVIGRRGRWIATFLILGYTIFLGWEIWVTVQLVLAQMRIT